MRGRAIRFVALVLSVVVAACAPADTAARSPTPSPTATSAPTATPDPSRCGATPTGTTGTLLFSSDLTDRCPAIGNDDNSQFRAIHTANGLEVRLKGGPTYELAGGPDPVSSLPPDVRVEVDVEEAAGGGKSLFGILCRVRPGRVLMTYQLLVARDGAYSIERRGGADPKTLAEGKAQAAPRPGANRVRADCIGSNLTLYLNGQLVATAQDTEFADGLAGIYARSLETAGAELVFRNLVIAAP